MSDALREVFIAVDVDVVETIVAAINQFGQVLGEIRHASDSFKEDRGVKTAVELAKQLIADKGFDMAEIKAIGISAPTLEIKFSDGKSTILPFMMMAAFEQAFPGIMVRAADDVTLYALGEYHYTYNTTPRSIFYLNWGNGIGGGLVLHGRVWLGSNFVAGNIGHLQIKGAGLKCWCGNVDCVSMYASGELMAGHYSKMLEQQKTPPANTLLKGIAIKDITPMLIMDAASKGDEVARKVLEMGTMALAKGLVSVINLINPEIIVIGGRVGSKAPDLVAKIKELTVKELMFPATKNTTIVQSKFENAGVLGAFHYVYSQYKAQQGKKTSKVLKALKK